MAPTTVRPTGRHRRTRQLLAVAAVGAAVLLVRALVAVPVVVTGSSMEPTLGAHDVALVWRLADLEQGLHRGDLVVFTDPDGALSVKRVVGLPGDRLDIRNSVLERDGRPVDEPYVVRVPGTYFEEVVVPARQLFVLGDNRFRSIDSRVYGPVDVSRVLGRVVLHS